MDAWERGKIAAAVALALGTMGGSAWLSSLIMARPEPQRRGYAIEGVAPVDLARAQRRWPAGDQSAGERAMLLGYVRHIDRVKVPGVAGTQAAASAEPIDLATLLVGADPARGQRIAQVCATCHTFEAGGPNRVGPNLHGIVGRKFAGQPGFTYSPALVKAGGRWTYETLDRFLTSPARAVPGTKMAFTGFRNPRDRAQVIAYLAALSPAAPPLPEAASQELDQGVDAMFR